MISPRELEALHTEIEAIEDKLKETEAVSRKDKSSLQKDENISSVEALRSIKNEANK